MKKTTNTFRKVFCQISRLELPLYFGYQVVIEVQKGITWIVKIDNFKCSYKDTILDSLEWSIWSLHEITAPTTGLWVGVIRQVYFVLIAVNKEASCFSLPFIINFGHWDNSHLVSLSQDLLLGKLAGVTGHQLSWGHLDHVVIHRLHPANQQPLLLEGDLAGHVPDEILR